MYSQTEKRQFTIFLLIAYGLTYVMGLFMWYGNASAMDVSVFPNAQMMYPAAGVALAYLITGKKEQNYPKGFYATFFVLAMIMAAMALISVFVALPTLGTAEAPVSMWTLISQVVIIIGSIVGWIALGVSGKEKRESGGLRWKKTGTSVFCIVLFLVIYILRTVVSYALSGQLSDIAQTLASPYTWINLAAMIPNFFLVFIAFFGEEYGWRYYMQPYLQRKFGLRGGVILLGVVWGLWHLPIDFFYYTTPDMGIIMAVSQQVTCIFLGIFLAYAYMKTNNIWVPVILHFLNNNLIPVLSADYSADILQNQQVTWAGVLFGLILNVICFGGFLFAKEFKKNDAGEGGEL